MRIRTLMFEVFSYTEIKDQQIDASNSPVGLCALIIQNKLSLEQFLEQQVLQNIIITFTA